MVIEYIGLAGLAAAIWELNQIRKYLRWLWINHYQLNRTDLEQLLSDDAPEPGRENGDKTAEWFNYKNYYDARVKKDSNKK
jgi:hypothetical protein